MAPDTRDNLARVRDRMLAACLRAGRRPEQVRLVAVSKTVPPDRIREAYNAGLRDFGENRVQEAISKRAVLSDLAITWHMIGHLQSNKAGAARDLFAWVHSVGSARLAERLDRVSPDTSGQPARLKVLIEVNLGGETSKSGVAEADAVELARTVSQLRTLELCGLMLVPPFFERAEQSRPFFSRLRRLAEMVKSAGLSGVSMDELSMGMSHDFEVAIEEGATLVRVGTAIFGARP